jgi:oxidoreductase family protein
VENGRGVALCSRNIKSEKMKKESIMSQDKEHNRRIVLAKRPHGAPVNENFRLETTPVPEPAEGQVLLRTEYLSLDDDNKHLTCLSCGNAVGSKQKLCEIFIF